MASDLPAYWTKDERISCWACRRDGERKVSPHLSESGCCRCGKVILPYGVKADAVKACPAVSSFSVSPRSRYSGRPR